MKAARHWTEQANIDVESLPQWYGEPDEGDDPWGADSGLRVVVVDACSHGPMGRSVTLVRYTPRPTQLSALAEILLGGGVGPDEPVN